MSRLQSYLFDPNDPDLVSKVQKQIPEFVFKFPDMEKLIRYTVYCYDPHADLLKLFPQDFNRRKYEAARLAGFTLNDEGRFDPDVEDAMVGKNDDYNNAMVEFVTSFNIADMPSFVMYREIFFTEFKAAMSAPDSKSKKEAMGNAEVARTRLTELEKRIFTDVETLEVRSALYVKAEKLKLQLRPEAVASLIERKELILSDPYYPKAVKRGRPRK